MLVFSVSNKNSKDECDFEQPPFILREWHKKGKHDDSFPFSFKFRVEVVDYVGFLIHFFTQRIRVF